MSLFAVILATFLLPVQIVADWGDFDSTFGFGGVSVDQVTGHWPKNVVIQSDGKILVTGYRVTGFNGKAFFLRRYLPNGNLDTAFGTNGAATGPESNSFRSDYRGGKIVILPDGRIAIAGWADGYYGVWQFTSTGARDLSFGIKGLRILSNYPLVGNAFPELNLQSSKLVVSLRKTVSGGSKIALVRLNSNGATDSAFGSSGESLTDMDGGRGTGTVIEPDGKITISGVRVSNPSAKGLERKLSNGQPDTTFSPIDGFAFGILYQGLVKLASGKYTMRMGNLASNGTITHYLDRYGSTGDFETSVSLYNTPSGSQCPVIFANQNDGKLVTSNGNQILRLNPDLDNSTIETYYCSNIDSIDSAHAAIQNDDKIVAAGVYSGNLTLVRILPN